MEITEFYRILGSLTKNEILENGVYKCHPNTTTKGEITVSFSTLVSFVN